MLKTLEQLNGSTLPHQKKIYFASDFHLGVPSHQESLRREKKIVRWLRHIEDSAAAIFLLGDIFDFWFEYKFAIPKGFVRLLGKLADLTDKNIPVFIFTGNHDMWMFDYFPDELNIPVIHNPVSISINNVSFFIGHGDGLGPGDRKYKFLKKIFRAPISKRLFALIHPTVGMWVAQGWSRKSRLKNSELDKQFFGKENEWIYLHCQEVEQQKHHDYYIFGHRHLPLNLPVSDNSQYINLGEWISDYMYASFDGHNIELLHFHE